VIAFDAIFAPRELIDPAQINEGFFELHGPRNIAGNKDDIIWGDEVFPGGGYAFGMIAPTIPKNIHGLGAGKRQMQV
jgi:hypothetical protein